MDSRRTVPAVGITLSVALVAVLGSIAVAPGVFGIGQYEHTTVTVYDENGAKLATIDVRVADTHAKRYTGLSDTESLEPGHGMLFVHESEGTYAYVMRSMAFPIDIVFVDANGTITRIHHAELPPPGTEDLKRYRGTGKYVLEVPYGYTNCTGIDVGDRIEIAGDY